MSKGGPKPLRGAAPPVTPIGGGYPLKPGVDSKGDLNDPKKSGRQHRRNLKSPCDRPPATPTGVQMIFRAVEAKNHLEFKARIIWNDVTADTSGFPITTVDRFDVEWRAVDADGDPIPTEHSSLTNATNPSGTTFRYTTSRNTDWVIGDRVKVTGCFPQTNYNGIWTISAKPAANQFEIANGTAGTGTVNRPGEVYNLSTQQDYDRKIRNPQPKMALRKAEFVVGQSAHFNITSTTNPSLGVLRINTSAPYSYAVNDYVQVQGVSPGGYNGVWKVSSLVDSDTFQVIAAGVSGLGAGGAGDVYKATTIFRYTTRGANGFNNGQSVRITGNRPETAYNGTWNITNITGVDIFEVQPNRNPDDPLINAQTPGSVFDDEDRLHVLVKKIPRPKTWRWQARVRARSGKGCWSAFSAWTSALLPWDSADPKPPAPTYGGSPITFDRVHHAPGKKRRWRLRFVFDEVQNWDVPGGDREEDVRAYLVQIDRSDDGTTWDGAPWYRKKLFMAKQDDDADTTRTSHFIVAPRQWYRARVRTIDRFNRHGDWSAWTSAAFPGDTTVPPAPLNVEIFAGSVNRVVTKWDDPPADFPTAGTVSGTSGTATLTGTNTRFNVEVREGTIIKVGGNLYTVQDVASATSLTLTTNLSTSPSSAVLYEVDQHYDVSFYQVQIAKFADVNVGTTPDRYSNVYMRDHVRGNRKAFKVKAADEGDIFYARVRSVDAAGNKSAWIPAWDTTLHSGNANNYAAQGGDAVAAAVNGDYVDIGAGGGAAIVATWKKHGRLRVKHYANARWTNTTGQTLTFRKARATCGNKEDGTGAPTGANIKVNIRVWDTAEAGSNPIWASDDTLSITAGTYKDINGPGTFDLIPTLLPDQAMSVTVKNVGSGFPGEDLTVQMYMNP